MSEYQFYEFRAIDKPLSKEDKAQIGSWSKRTNPSNTGAIFTYSYGDFPKDVIAVMEKYFDAMFYIANYGITRLIFKFPKPLLKTEIIRQYCTQDGLKIIENSDFILLDFEYSDEDGGGGWIDGDDWLSSLITLRDDIINEDYRCLYLFWLKISVAAVKGEWGTIDSSDLEPQVPKQLNELNDALQNFVEIFEIKKDYIKVAAENSPLNTIENPIDLEIYIDQLSENEKVDFLNRILNEEPFLNLKLKTRLKEFVDVNDSLPIEKPRRTIFEIIQKAKEAKRERKYKENMEREEKHLQRMRILEGREVDIWIKVEQLIAEKNTKAYDEAVELLKELKDLSIFKNCFNDFCKEIEKIRIQNSRLSGLTNRISSAKLLVLD